VVGLAFAIAGAITKNIAIESFNFMKTLPQKLASIGRAEPHVGFKIGSDSAAKAHQKGASTGPSIGPSMPHVT
jgi:hypothetical protein